MWNRQIETPPSIMSPSFPKLNFFTFLFPALLSPTFCPGLDFAQICFVEAPPVTLIGSAAPCGGIVKPTWCCLCPALDSPAFPHRGHPCCPHLATYSQCTLKQEQTWLHNRIHGFMICPCSFIILIFYWKGEEIFLDMFEDEYRSMTVSDTLLSPLKSSKPVTQEREQVLTENYLNTLISL